MRQKEADYSCRTLHDPLLIIPFTFIRPEFPVRLMRRGRDSFDSVFGGVHAVVIRTVTGNKSALFSHFCLYFSEKTLYYFRSAAFLAERIAAQR